MGTICAQPTDKEECNESTETSRKNLVQLHGNLANNVSVDLIFGTHALNQGIIVSAKVKVCW